MGIGGTTLNLNANYLDNRKQCVKINNSRSEFRDVTSGVPQGSLLGSLLFLIYINELTTVASESECVGYADDQKMLSTSHELLESDQISLHNWCVAKKMNLHDDKCSLIHFKKQSVVKMNEVAVKPVKVQKDLGVLISNDLSWKEYCNLRRTKSLKSLWFLKRNISFKSTTKANLNAYTGYVAPLILYACEVWYPTKTDLSNIERIQKSATQWILNKTFPYKERLKELNLLPLSMYFELHSLLMFCAITDHKYDIKTSDYISRNTNERTRQGSNSSFNIPKTRLKRTDDNFWTRNGTLHNILNKHIDLTTKENRKERITQQFWKFFEKFNEANLCTWRILCRCTNCNQHSKLTH